MGRKTLVGTVATLGVMAFVGLFASLSLLFSSPHPVYAQTNNAPVFPPADANEDYTRNVDENSPAFHPFDDPVKATPADANDRLVYTLENARTSPFTIVRATGQLQVGQPLDYETTPSYKVKVIVTDSDDATDSITVTINVNNVEEYGKLTLSWTRPQVDTAITATLIDPDGSISGTTWQWQKSTNRNSWSNATGTGAMSATYTPVTADEGNYLRATASYTDGESSSTTRTAEVVSARQTRTEPLNNNPPAFGALSPGQGYSCSSNEAYVCLNIPRKAPAGDDVYYPVKATDPDRDEIRYSLSDTISNSGDAALFRIDQTRGTLYTTAAHVYDNPTGGKFEITITATDPSDESDSITVVLRPSGGEGPPVVNGPSRITYPENGTWALATYSATAATAANEDSGNRPIEGWTIAVQPGGGDGDFFDIDDDGNLTFTQPPDYENPADYPDQGAENGNNTYSFSLHVYDTNPPNRGRPAQTFFNVTVIVTNETVEALEIDGPTSVRYPEYVTGPVSPVATYSLLRASAPVDEWVLSGADGDEFTISTAGVLTFNSPPDFENPTDAADENTYRVTITAYAGTQSKTEFVFVRVTDVNEPPEFDEGETATRSVEPDAAVNSLVGDPVKATDPDKNDGLTYTLPDAATLPFTISEYTGQLSVSGTIDQARDSYAVAVIVTDNGDEEDAFDDSEDDRITVTVDVAGGGNNAPEFPSSETVARSIAENTRSGVNVGDPVTATDADNDTPTYTLEGTDAASFEIGSSDGQIQTKTGVTYDYETKPTYSVTVKADDNNGGTDTKAVTITLTNVEEDGTVTLSPTQPASRAAITATLTDLDGGVTGTTWQWAKSSDGNSAWANVGTNSPSYMPVDGDVNYYLRATASYTDGHGANKSAHAVSASAVQTGTNRAPTFDDDQTTTRDVAEGTAANGNVDAVVAATDQDSDTLTYSLTGADASSFTVDNSGQIKVGTSTTLEYESTKKAYTVIVQVTDGKNAAGDTEQTATIDDSIIVTINVTNVNEASEFDSATAVRSIAENSPEDTNVGIPVTATDPESGDTLTYSLSGTDAGSFTIDSTGQIKVGASPTLDYESAKKTYRVDVDVRDSKDNTGTADTATDDTIEVTINVTGVNEKPTFNDRPTAARGVPENTPAGEDIGNAIAATDPESDTLTYTLGGTDAADFSIVGTSGQLQTKSALDKETKASYEVTVSVHDGTNAAGGSNTTVDDTTTVTITVTEENDPPVFPDTSTTREVAENTGANVNIGDPVAATDDDTGDTQTYSLDGTDKDSFTIVPGTGQIQTKSGVTYNHETKATYSVTVKVVDNKGGTDTIAVTIDVTNVNEKPTFDDGQTATREVPENTATTQAFGDAIAATDPENDSLTYTLGGTDAADFTIVRTSGQLQTKSALDREDKDSYSVVVSVHDGKNEAGDPDTSVDDTIGVTINVTEENEPPEITAAPASVDYAEDRTDAVATYTATDPENSQTITWSLSGDDWEDFSIDIEGELTFNSPPDHEAPVDADTNNVYLVTVTADDGNGNTDTIALTITVTDVNENPTFNDQPATSREVSENTGTGQDIGLPVAATDPDTGNTLTYSIDATGATSFDIDSASGQIKTKSGVTYDHETEPTHSVTVKADDGNGGTDTIAVTINVTNVNEAPTVEGETSVSYPENDAGTVATYSATDPEDDQITWKVLGTDGTHFHINSAGELTFDSSPDFEGRADADQNNEYLVTVQASDGPKTHQIEVTVTVTDVNEAPVFPARSDARSVAENTPADQNIGTWVTAEDPDAGDTLMYTLGGADVASFAINTSTGQLQTKADLDKETKDIYTVTVTASDGSLPTTQEVTITVTDVNEKPAFNNGETATLAVAENTEPGENVGVPVEASDPDVDATLTYSLGGTDDSFFSIDGSTGQIKVGTGTDLDHETTPSYSVTVSVRDGKDDNGIPDTSPDATIPVTINVDDRNEPPDITAGPASESYAENRTDAVATYNASDPENATLEWTLAGDDADDFSIAEGVLEFASQPNFEAPADEDRNNEYLVTVQASDGDHSDTLSVTITVTDANDRPAFPGPTATRSIAENTIAGQSIGTPVEADDPDGHTLTYTLGVAGAASFDIDAASGQLLTKIALDHETTYTYEVVVSVTDSKAGDGSADSAVDASITVTITVTDVNEPPEITGDPTFNYPENGMDPVATYTTTDPEEVDLVWSLGGDDSNFFSITEGVLSFKNPPDFENPADAGPNNTYNVTVTVSDGSLTDDIDVTITVTNVDEAGKVTLSSLQPQARTGLVATATDPDIIKVHESWKWEISSVPNGWSPITGANAGTYVPLDGDVGKSLRVTATYTDILGSGKTVEAVSANPVQAAPDSNVAPVFASLTVPRTIAEGEVLSRSVGEPVSATDGDDDTLTYTLGGTDAASFGIVPGSGQLTTKIALDHETKASYTVEVTATDPSGVYDTITVNITVTNVNERPAFAKEVDSRSVDENTAAGQDIGAPFTATDQDVGDTPTYTLGGQDAASFDIVQTTGQLRTKDALDHETKARYTVEVTATDTSGLYDTIAVTITVTDVNDSPVFSATPYTRTVAENTVTGANIGAPVTATDDDPDTLTYSLVGQHAASFDIEESSGQLQTKAALDHEMNPSYTVTVRADDGNGGTGTIDVTITVSDVNERPDFDSATASRTVRENTQGGQPVGQPVPAVDPDDGDTVTYSLGGADSESFGINSNTGQITVGTGTTLDFEAPTSYTVTVTATDSFRLSDIITVTIEVTQGNDPPVFATDTATRRVAENTAANTNLGDPFTATDADVADVNLTYTLEGTDAASFDIVAGSGQLKTKDLLDYETKSGYSVTVKASDGTGTIDVTITVTDVNEPPQAPAAPVVSGHSDDSVSVTWTAPANAGRPAITDYHYQYKKTAEQDWTGPTFTTTGTVTSVTINRLDAGTSYDVQVRARNNEGTGDWSPPGAGSPTTTPNDAPTFASQTVTRDVAENTPANTAIGQPVEATDTDSGDTVTYTLGGADVSSFDIVATSGQLKTKAPLDHEAKDTYTVTVTATDSIATAEATVTITVTDVKEPPLTPEAPAMAQTTDSTLTMTWTAPNNAGRSAITDYDYQYKKTADTTWTEVTNTTITDTSIAITGLDTNTSYDVQVRATNADGTSDWSASGLGVTTTRSNTPPAFPGPTTTRQVAEDAQVRQDIGNPVDAQDMDNDGLTYMLEGFDAGSFMIDDSTGQLKTKMPLDHEAKSDYSVLVKAEDGRGGSDTIAVTIKVTNVNEPPEFSGNLGAHSVTENTAPGVDIGAPVAATDEENDPLTYSLDSAGAHAFDIDASTGQLRTKVVLDYETARTHSVVVNVSDRKNAQGTTDTAVDDDISVTITVTNVNEPPAFTEAAPSRSVPENSGIGTDVGYPVTATDPDGDTLTYSLDGTDKDFFSIDRSSGQLKTGTELDFESGKTSYRVTVSVSDGKDASGNTDTTTDATVTVTIAVTDENEPPAVTISSTVRYAENGADPVDTYTATDPESGTITWDLSGTDMDDFTINNGVLEFKTPPNYEAPADADTNNVYLVTVEVSDGNSIDQLGVTVTVFNVNEPPAFPAETGGRSVDENTAAGQTIGDAVAATDPERHTLIYKLAGTDGNSFAIDTSTGPLRTRAPLDYEAKSTYLVTVHVRDSKDQDDRVNAVTDDTINITATINNVEEAGRIVLSSRQPQIGTAFTATIIDPDSPNGVNANTITWKWERSILQSSGWTLISGETLASYTPDTPADDNKYLQVTATYTDGHGPNKIAVKGSDNAVRATPADNVAPAFASTTATRAVDEGIAAGQNIGAPVAATDSDTGDANLLTYSLSGTDAASFEINRATGQLLTNAPLDHETKDSYSVTVKAGDPSLLSDTITVTITVNDVDEPPVLSGPDVVDYPENGADAVARYTAVDPENDQISWSLEGDDKDLFEINGGALTFKSSPDHDIPGDDDNNNVYLVTVKVTARTSSVTLDVEVTVSNVNEEPEFPAFETGDRTVAENTAADQDIGAPVEATDPDDGDTLTYTLGGTDAGSFAIDETTGQLKTKAGLDHEVEDTYTVTVTATDPSGLSITITVTVTVTSVNEPPQFPTSETGQRRVAENTPAGQDIGAAVAATDPETDTMTYTLGGADAASFAIDETTGQLKTRDPLDYETKASYSVTVSVSDSKNIDGNNDPSADNTIDVTITVTDLDEAGNVILSSLQPQVDTALTATLEDPDGGAPSPTWKWESSSNWSSDWTTISDADSDTYTPVTGDLNKYLRATASYTNSASAQASAHGISAYPVRAAPAPGSNVAPAFTNATATRSIPEDTPVGSAVGDPVTATDTNADDILTYSLSGTDAASFTIGMASGQLRTKVSLDHDTKGTYTVVVTAADPSGLSDTITVTITVTDENEPPEIDGNSSVYYPEDLTDPVATYTATDPENGTITWSLAGDDSEDFTIGSSTGVLIFNTPPDRENPADEDTNNVYLVTVQASDGTNTVTLDVTVTVTDEADPPPAPGAPTVEAAATDGHTALRVSWQAPSIAGVSPINGYEVEYRKEGAEDWSSENVTITDETAAITSVLPDTLYEVRVRAQNADGAGAWSEPGTGRTEVTPLDQQIDLTVSYRAAGYTVNEGATVAVSVTLSAAADRALQIPITVAPLTAEPGDYRVTGLTNGALAFVPGDSSKRLTFEALQDTDTSDETVTLGFGQLPDKVTAGNRPTTVVTIDDDDTTPPRRRSSSRGGGGGGGGGTGSYGSSSPANKAPVFTEGTSASRSVAENTAAGVNIGATVTATDADKDTLTYTVGGDDGSAFAVDEDTGQLKTKSALDFETKSTYRVTMGVFDPNGGSDTITVTITVTDVADVSLVNGTTQMIGVVDSEQDTTVSTLDGGVAVTFPSGSRSGDYQVRLDHGLNNCNPNFANEELWFCLTVDIFDNEGNLEQGVVLSRPATIKIRRNGDERGGVDAVLGLHAQGGISVYTSGRTGGEWTESAFTLESDGVGGIVITITGVSSFGLYAGTTDSSVPVQVSHQVATVPVPTATPQNTGGQESSPEPTPTPTPTPQPGSSSEQSTTPEPTPTPAPVVTQGTNPTPEPTLGHQVSFPFGPLGGPAATPTPAPTPVGIAKGFGNLASVPPPDGDSVPTAEPEVKGALFDPEGGKSGGIPPWYIAIIMMALAATIAGGSTYFVKRRQRLPYPVTVQRSREFNKWWSG